MARMKIGLLTTALLWAGAMAVADSKHGQKHGYDYIIVGGGTSGLVVANRLTEDPDVTVLIIEVGDLDDSSPGTLVPGIQTPQKYWRTYQSIPQPELYNRTSKLDTAQVVGGGTVINGMFFARGSKEDYDAWEELGNEGWGWEGLLPYFEKSETFVPASAEVQAEVVTSPSLEPHGTAGPVGSGFPEYLYGTVKQFLDGWGSIGVKLNAQPNDGKAIGAFYSPLSLAAWNMSRSHASVAYFKGEPRRRRNLRLLTGHRVHRVLFKRRRARAVEFSSSATNTTQRVYARQEVIIAAGAQRSPQVLQLSGIGPRSLLEKHRIDIVEDLPGVGYNFHDQPNYFFFLNYTNWTQPTTNWIAYDIEQHREWADEQLQLYYAERKGVYTVPYLSGGEAAFLPLRNVMEDFAGIIESAKLVDLDGTLPSGAGPTILRGQQEQQAITLRHLASPSTATMESVGVIIVNLKPLSRGSILINSTNPYEDPLIDFGTFKHPTDLEILHASFKKNREWIQSSPMQEMGTVELSPGSSVASDVEIENELRNGTLSSWQHPVGTLAMLPRELGGVVDERLCVYGVEGLRVVDASVMPMIPASHTSSTVYAVAEKAADLVKKGWCEWERV